MKKQAHEPHGWTDSCVSAIAKFIKLRKRLGDVSPEHFPDGRFVLGIRLLPAANRGDALRQFCDRTGLGKPVGGDGVTPFQTTYFECDTAMLDAIIKSLASWLEFGAGSRAVKALEGVYLMSDVTPNAEPVKLSRDGKYNVWVYALTPRTPDAFGTFVHSIGGKVCHVWRSPSDDTMYVTYVIPPRPPHRVAGIPVLLGGALTADPRFAA